MRERKSRNQPSGSTPDRLRDAMKLRNTAAVLLPLSLPKKSSCRGLARCRGWLAPWRPYRSPTHHVRESASAPPTDSGHSERQRRKDSSAEPAAGTRADIDEAFRPPVTIRAGAMPTFAPPSATAPWRAPPPHTGVRFRSAPVQCVAGWIPTP
jgi:hypothetical protein